MSQTRYETQVSVSSTPVSDQLERKTKRGLSRSNILLWCTYHGLIPFEKRTHVESSLNSHILERSNGVNQRYNPFMTLSRSDALCNCDALSVRARQFQSYINSIHGVSGDWTRNMIEVLPKTSKHAQPDDLVTGSIPVRNSIHDFLGLPLFHFASRAADALLRYK